MANDGRTDDHPDQVTKNILPSASSSDPLEPRNRGLRSMDFCFSDFWESILRLLRALNDQEAKCFNTCRQYRGVLSHITRRSYGDDKFC